jgi:leader peptidase (prepilin peptidase) / N-methyltransferase
MPDSLALGAFFEAPLWPWTALVLGLIVGSFANVCIHRVPRRESVMTPPSRCPSCGTLIRPWDNVPLVSYALLAGRCRSCRAGISPRYPAVEAVNGLAWFAVATLRGGPTLQAAVDMMLVTILLVLSLIDLDHQLLPNVITLPGIALGVLASFLPGPPTPLVSVLSAAGGYLVFWGIAAAYRHSRGIEGLGQGDWKMAAMLGAFLGWEKTLLTVFLATLSGTVVGLFMMAFRGRTTRYALPLGTFLGAAGALVVMVGDPILAWYRGFFEAP